MKNTYKLYALGAAFVIIGGLSGLIIKTSSAASANCTDSSQNPYSLVCSDKITYRRGENVNFSLYQNRIPLFIGPEEKPWKITDGNGKTVYQPNSIHPTEAPAPSFTYRDSWNQKDTNGRTVIGGDYYIVFENAGYNTPQLKIEITNGNRRDPRDVIRRNISGRSIQR